MDPTHFLAAQTFPRRQTNQPPPRAEIDAFYDAHGHEVFARVFRFRRWLKRHSARQFASARNKRGFAPVASNR